MTDAVSGIYLPASRDSTGGKGAPPPPKKIDLRNAEAMRREMAAVYRDMRNGKIETKDGTRLMFALNALRQAYETDLLEKRLERLEEELHVRYSKTP